MARLRSSNYHDYDEALPHIKQDDTLREYQKEFEFIASRVHDWPEKALVGAFIKGLKVNLATEVRVYQPKIYRDDVEMARLRRQLSSSIEEGKGNTIASIWTLGE